MQFSKGSSYVIVPGNNSVFLEDSLRVAIGTVACGFTLKCCFRGSGGNRRGMKRRRG